MTLQTDVQRGEMARQVLENEVYAEAYTLLESEITRAWRESRDRDEREELHRALRSLAKVRTVLESMAQADLACWEIVTDRGRLQQRVDQLYRQSWTEPNTAGA